METPVVPTASPAPLPELATYLEPFAPLFRRSTSRESLERYVTGLLTDLPHKNCDTIAAAVAGTSTERLQYLLTDAVWEPQARPATRAPWWAESAPGPRWCWATPDCPSTGAARSAWPARMPGRWARAPHRQVVVSAHYGGCAD
jgi:SRSO17 transposase